MTNKKYNKINAFFTTISAAILLLVPMSVFASVGVSAHVDSVGPDCAVIDINTSNSVNQEVRYYYVINKNVPGTGALHEEYSVPGNKKIVIAGLEKNTLYYVYAGVFGRNSTEEAKSESFPFRTLNKNPLNATFNTTECEGAVPGNGITGGGYFPDNGTSSQAANSGNASSAGLFTAGTTAGGVTNTSAVLTATVYPVPNTATYGWFEWGKTPDLGNETTHVLLPNTQPVIMTATVNGLIPGTTYFYRPVTQSAYGIKKGELYSFRTTGTSPSTISPSSSSGNGASGGVTKPGSSKSLAGTQGKTSGTVAKTGASDSKNPKNTASSTMAAAGTAGNHAISFGGWILFTGHILLFLAMYLFYVFFYKGREEENDDILGAGQGDGTGQTDLIPQMIAIPVAKDDHAEKGAPPSNLPV